MLEGVASTQKQYKGSLIKNGVNANALNTQEVTDMGDGPIFYTVLAQIKKLNLMKLMNRDKLSRSS